MPEKLSLLIEKLVYGGEGLAHADGNTVFVPYVLPGEKVTAEVRARKKKVVWGTLLEVSSASKERTQPVCPHFGICGGCHYQQISYAEQVRLKKEILRETLRRIGGIPWEQEIMEHTAQPYGYRNRAQWAVRRGMPRALGYYLPESSTIVPIDQCPVLSPVLAQVFQTLQEMARGGTLPGEVKEIEAFTDSTDTKIALNVAFSHFAKSPTEFFSLFKDALAGLESLLLLDQKTNRFELSGPGYLTHETAGFRFRVSHLSFFQVNRFLIEDVLKSVTAEAKGELAFDLYAGVGFFTLLLAKSFRRVISVDANLTATHDLRVNAENAGVPVTSHNMHVEDFLMHCSDKPNFIVLDPPGAGLGVSGAEILAQLGAQQMAYLSCDPATLARDLAILTQNSSASQAKNSRRAGYEISEVHFFDLFPQTYHIETLVRLRLAA